MTGRRHDVVLRALAEQLAADLERTPEQVLTELREAVSAGLLRVTHRGVEATIPGEPS